MERIVEIQRKSKTGVWTGRLDERFDGPNWFFLRNGKYFNYFKNLGKPLDSSLESVKIPSAENVKSWIGNWKIEKASEEETKIDGWETSNKFVIRCANGTVLRYPPIIDRPLRKRTWTRKFGEVALQEEVLDKDNIEKDTKVLQQALVDKQVEHNNKVLQERRKEIVKLSKDVKEVNETMQALGKLIAAQGETIETASDAVEKTKLSSEAALKELEKAEKMQSTSDCDIM